MAQRNRHPRHPPIRPGQVNEQPTRPDTNQLPRRTEAKRPAQETMTSEPELRPDLDPRHTFPTGASVIHHGLPELPEVLTHQMSIPISYWTATGCAVVTFLRFRPHPVNSEIQPTATTVCYAKNGDTLTGRQGMYAERRFAFDPVTKPGQASDLHGRAMVYGGPARHKNPNPATRPSSRPDSPHPKSNTSHSSRTTPRTGASSNHISAHGSSAPRNPDRSTSQPSTTTASCSPPCSTHSHPAPHRMELITDRK
jgi:hypothetical protein